MAGCQTLNSVAVEVRVHTAVKFDLDDNTTISQRLQPPEPSTCYTCEKIFTLFRSSWIAGIRRHWQSSSNLCIDIDRASLEGSVFRDSTPWRHVDFVGSLAPCTATSSVLLIGACNFEWNDIMRSHRTRSRVLNLSFCILTTSVIAACGGGGNPGDPAAALDTSIDGRTAIASAFATPSDFTNVTETPTLPTVAQEFIDPASSHNNQESASGGASDATETTLTDTSADLSTLPATSAGPLQMDKGLIATTVPTKLALLSPVVSSATASDGSGNPLSSLALIPPGTGVANLKWSQPTTRADGQAIGALSGYRIYYGSSSGIYSGSVYVSGGSNLAGTVSGLGKGVWYFAVTTVDASGNESGFGYEMSKSL